MSLRFKKIAVKIGSNVLTRADGTLDITRMSALVDQISQLHKNRITSYNVCYTKLLRRATISPDIT